MSFGKQTAHSALPKTHGVVLSDKCEPVSDSSNLNLLGYAKTAPLGQSSDMVQFEA
jgi:hypothetical protein